MMSCRCEVVGSILTNYVFDVIVSCDNYIPIVEVAKGHYNSTISRVFDFLLL